MFCSLENRVFPSPKLAKFFSQTLGISRAVRQGLKTLEVKGDSQLIMNWMAQDRKEPDSWDLKARIQEVREGGKMVQII